MNAKKCTNENIESNKTFKRKQKRAAYMRQSESIYRKKRKG